MIEEFPIEAPKREPHIVPVSFKKGFRGILLVHRPKEGGANFPQRRGMKKISSCESEWDDIIADFKELQSTSYPNHRIYSSVNMRSMPKSMREFKRRQLDADYDQIDLLYEFYRDITNRFFSCFMGPGSKLGSNFLIDCDSEDEYQHALNYILENQIVTHHTYTTKNGKHIITDPFNPKGWSGPEIHKDGLLWIA